MEGNRDNKDIDNLNNLDLAYNIMTRKLEFLNNAHNSLESKIGILVGFVSLILMTIVGILVNKSELLNINIFTLGIFSSFTSLVLLIIAYRSQTYTDPLDFETFYSEHAFNRPHKDLKIQVIADMKACYNENNTKQCRKALIYNVALFFLIMGMLLLFIGIIEVRR